MKPQPQLFYHKVVRLLSAFTVILFWVTLIDYLYSLIGLPEYESYYVSLPQAILSLLFAPVIEEIVFRWLPWQALAKNKGSDVQLAVIFGSSVIFGLMHGSPFAVLIQGVFGLACFWVYVRNGSLVWSMVLHSMWNVWVLYLSNSW